MRGNGITNNQVFQPAGIRLQVKSTSIAVGIATSFVPGKLVHAGFEAPVSSDPVLDTSFSVTGVRRIPTGFGWRVRFSFTLRPLAATAVFQS